MLVSGLALSPAAYWPSGWHAPPVIALLNILDIFIYQSNYLAQKIVDNLRNEIFERIISFKIKYFDNTPTGQLITRVVSDVEAISLVFSQGLLVVLGDFFKIFLIVTCMFFVNWRLACVSLIFLPFLVFVTIVFQKYMRRAFVDVRKYISKSF